MGASSISPDQHHGTRRVEDEALLRGLGNFSDDLRVEGQAVGVFVRSEYAHARIESISTDDAADHPGVIAVLTSADMEAAGAGSVARPPPLAGRDGTPLVVPHRPPLARDRVVHIGEPVALVVAENEAAARAAAELVEIDYDDLPAVVSARDALEAGAPQVWDAAPGNLAIDWQASEYDADEMERIFAGAAHVVSIETTNQRIAGVPLEPRGATGVYDAERDHFTLHAPSQSAHVMKAQVCAILGLDPGQLQVLTGDVGGAFGLKTPPHPEYVAVLVAAKLTGRPVHWRSARSEAFLSDHQGRDNSTEASLALDADGRFLALRVSAVTNLGAYVTSAGALIASIGFARCFPAMYDITKLSVEVKLAFTNTVPTGPYRGAGRPEANYVLERLVDAASRQTGIDKLELRRRNLIPESAMPYRSAVGNLYDSGAFEAVLDKAVGLADFGGLAERQRASQERGFLRGVGICCMLEHAGGGPTEGAVLDFDRETLSIRLGVQASGQGHATVFGALAAQRLGVPADRIAVLQGDSDLPIKGGPSVGSRSTNAAGTAISAGVGQLVEKAKAAGAAVFGADPGDVIYRDGYLEVPETNHRLSLFELAGRVEKDALKVVAQVDADGTFPNGCHIAEVEIDPETGSVSLARYVAVDDCGVVLDHTLADAQVVGGLAQGFGQALLEHVVYDETGQLLSGSLMDYAMPRADFMPKEIVSEFHPVPSTVNPLGVKGVGEAGTTGAIGAVMNAIADAIPGPEGAVIEMPATPEKVWRACRGQA